MSKESMILQASEPEFERVRYSTCDNCLMLEQCRERVKSGGWCYCEIPDDLDYLFVSNVLQTDAAIKLLEKRSPITGRFEKGNIAWNTGMNDFDPSPATHFKPGNRPQTWVPVGTESISKGYMRVKVAEPNVWRQRSHIIWEEHHGRSLPDGWIVRHKDGDPLNDAPDNLEAMPRSKNLAETLKDPIVLMRKKDRAALAIRERWEKYRRIRSRGE